MISPREIAARLLSSEVKGDLLSLFHRNPGLIDTVEGVALRIGRMGEVVEDDVRDLLDLGLLKAKGIGGQRILSLNRVRDREIQALLAEHVRSSSDATERN